MLLPHQHEQALTHVESRTLQEEWCHKPGRSKLWWHDMHVRYRKAAVAAVCQQLIMKLPTKSECVSGSTLYSLHAELTMLLMHASAVPLSPSLSNCSPPLPHNSVHTPSEVPDGLAESPVTHTHGQHRQMGTATQAHRMWSRRLCMWVTGSQHWTKTHSVPPEALQGSTAALQVVTTTCWLATCLGV